MIYDVITFNGEDELFEIRYNILKDYVDEFRVIEFDKTFSGKKKKPLFHQKWEKVKHFFVKEYIWGDYKPLARSSPNTQYGQGPEHWVTEFAQKESIRDCLTDLQDGDTVFIGDCDEVFDPTQTPFANWPIKLKLRVYSYSLNNRSSEEFWGTIRTTWGAIKNECLNHTRSMSTLSEDYYGWHFTSMGGHDKVKEKLTDSYTNDSYANDWVMTHLQDNVNNSKDFLGREFSYKIDESEWPQYLKDNRVKYKHLLRS